MPLRSARVTAATRLPDGTVRMEGQLSTPSRNGTFTPAGSTFVATAKPYMWKNKQTWALLTLQCTHND